MKVWVVIHVPDECHDHEIVGVYDNEDAANDAVALCPDNRWHEEKTLHSEASAEQDE